MKYFLYVFLVLGLLGGVGSQAEALIDVQSLTGGSGGSVNVGGNQIDVSNTGGVKSVNVGTGTQNLNVTGTGSSGTVNVGGVDIDLKKIDPDKINSVDITTPTGSMNIERSGNNTLLIRNSEGKSASLDLNAGGLNVQLNSGKIDGNVKSAVVELNGDSRLLIQTEDDLQTYNSIVIEERPSVASIETKGNAITVGYHQPAKFLGIFSSNLGAKVVVSEGGAVEIDLPWYSFLFSKNTKKIKTSIATGVSENKGNVNVSVSGNNKSVKVQQQAETVNIITSAIEVSSN